MNVSEHAASGQGDRNRLGADFSEFVAATVASQPRFSGLPWLGDLVQREWIVAPECKALVV